MKKKSVTLRHTLKQLRLIFSGRRGAQPLSPRTLVIMFAVAIFAYFPLFFLTGFVFTEKDEGLKINETRFLAAVKAASTPFKAIMLFAGSSCPPGFITTTAAGLGNWDGRYPLMVNDPTSGASGNARPDNLSVAGTPPYQVGLGGDSLITINELPSHSHAVTEGDTDSGDSTNKVDSADSSQGSTWNTQATGGSAPYWPRFVKLLPCVWQDPAP